MVVKKEQDNGYGYDNGDGDVSNSYINRHFDANGNLSELLVASSAKMTMNFFTDRGLQF